LWLNPSLPEGLSSLTLSVRYRQHLLRLYLTRSRLRVSTEPCEEKPIRIGIVSDIHEFRPGEVREFQL